ncbi:MAG: DMT family transporter [Bacteroidaceae bacterium]|nr:DMT family transporter [Bacteroides sp.]MBQ4587852.1 DMT family transporter [Bacteroidaceae bacterium]
MKEKTVGHLACFIAYAIFGINIIVCKDLTSSRLISPIALFCLRSLGAGLLFWLISNFLPTEKVEKKDYIKIFLASVLGFFLTQMTFLMAIPDITPMDCSIVSSLSPIYTMFIAAYALREPITTRKVGGVLLSFCGVIYLIMNSVTGTGGTIQTSIVGILLMIANSLCFSLYLGLFKPTITKYSVITFMKWIFLFASLLSLPLAGKELVTFDYSQLSGMYLGELAFLIVCSTFITYFLIPVGQKRIRPTLVSMYSYVQPIIAIVISICIGMDTLNWQKVLAAATVFGGVVLVNYSRSAKPA